MIGRGASHDAQSFDDAWTSRDRSGLDGEIADLVQAADLLCRSAVAEPSPDFRTSLRARLMTEAADVLVTDSPTADSPTAESPTVESPAPARAAAPARSLNRRRRYAGLTAALVTGVGAVGMVSSSATAVPGDVLYPVKRGVESIQLATHRDDTSRGEYQLSLARERLAEAWWLDSNDKDDRVAEALDDFSAQASAGSARLFDAYDADSSDARIDSVTDFAAASTVTLTRMSDDLPDDAQAALDAAATTLSDLATQASTLCDSCATADLSSLLSAVEDAADATPPDTTAAKEGSSGSSGDGTPSTGSGPGGSSTQAPASGGSAPAAPRPPATPRLTDPSVGGLLGDDDEEGLVPGLLGGLLGTQK